MSPWDYLIEHLDDEDLGDLANLVRGLRDGLDQHDPEPPAGSEAAWFWSVGLEAARKYEEGP